MSGIPLSATGPRGYDTGEVSDETAIDTGKDTMVQQQFGIEQDVNTIVKRFGLTGNTPFGSAAGVYGDFTGICDYSSAMEVIERAQKGFMTLPPDVRERFENDPGRMIAYAQSVPEEEFIRAFEPNVVEDQGGVVPPVDSGS